MRRMVAALACAGLLAGCGGKQLTNKQLAAGAVGVGAVAGMLVLHALVAECEQDNGGQCRDPDEPTWPR